jgi:anti-anti-sigma factor
MDGLSISVTEDSPPVLHVAGELDIATAGQLGAALERAVSADPALVVDLGDVTFVDAAGLHVILQVAQRRNGGPPLVVLNAPRVAWLLEVVGLEDLPSIDVRGGGGGHDG